MTFCFHLCDFIRCCCFFLLKNEKNSIHQQKKNDKQTYRVSQSSRIAPFVILCAHGIAQAFVNVPFFWLTEQQMTGRIGNYLDTHHWDNFSINKITNSYDQFWWMYCANYAQHQFIYIFSSQFVGSFIFIHLFLHIENCYL